VHNAGYVFVKKNSIGEIGVLKFIDWASWQPRTANMSDMQLLRWPVSTVIISHTAYVGRCSTTNLCCREVKEIQDLHMTRRTLYANYNIQMNSSSNSSLDDEMNVKLICICMSFV